MKFALAGLAVMAGYFLCVSLENRPVSAPKLDTDHRRVRPRGYPVHDPRNSYWRYRQAMFWGYESN